MPAYLVTVSHGPRVIGQVIWTDVDQSPLVNRGYLREVPKEVLDEYPGSIELLAVRDHAAHPDAVAADPGGAGDRPKARKRRTKTKVTEEVLDVEVGAGLPGDPEDVEGRGDQAGDPADPGRLDGW
jgi:hypothetical protein